MKVREIMTSRLVCATPDASLPHIARQMVDNDCGEIPIIDTRQNNKLVGVITDRDIVCRVVAQGRNPRELTAEDCMSSPVLTVSSDADDLTLVRGVSRADARSFDWLPQELHV